MRHKKQFYSLTITALTVALAASCNTGIGETENGEQETLLQAEVMRSDETESIADSSTVAVPNSPLLDGEMVETETLQAGSLQSDQTENKERKAVKAASSETPSYGGKETLYISTYGANGKVWGHVTMNGKTGRGTIHDDDENSYSITVTRHGGELYGTDQNGRQYVFRL